MVSGPQHGTIVATRPSDVWQALERHAAAQPNRIALSSLSFAAAGSDSDDRGQSVEVTYGQLLEWSEAVAARLAVLVKPGESVLLLYASGLDFVAAFLGCLRAGVVAVPAPPPRRPYQRFAERLAGIVGDAGIRLAATTADVSVEELIQLDPRLAELRWLEVGSARTSPAGHSRVAANLDPEATAYLQYTSGSTSQPKGVQVTHANLIEQVYALDERFEHDPDSVMVTWLPLFHDMGLIYTVLAPLVLGFPAVLMLPEAFVARPIRWLRTISDRGGTHTISPDFGYALCVRKTAEPERLGLDLRTWRVAANASEPIRARTISDFARTFEPYGLPAGAHSPAYGLAEATLVATGSGPDDHPRWLAVDRRSLRGGPVRTTEDAAWPVVSCGRAFAGFDLRIVDPLSRQEVPERTVGEVWLAGPCVAAGYYRNPEATAEIFHGIIEPAAGGSSGEPASAQRFLRTGDLGFMARGELYVTGRRKDVIIKRGQNYYPQDIEHIAEQAHAALRPGCGAAFALDDHDELLGLIYEVSDDVPAECLPVVAAAVRTAVTEAFGVRLDTIQFMSPGTVPKTSSGKIRRATCRRRFAAWSLVLRQPADGQGPCVWKSATRHPAGSIASPRRRRAPRGGLTAGLLKPTVRRLVSRILALEPNDVDDATPLAAYGLDSVGAAELAELLEGSIGVPVPSTVAFDNPTVDELAGAMAELTNPAA